MILNGRSGEGEASAVWLCFACVAILLCATPPCIAKQQTNELGPVRVTTKLAPDAPTIGDEIVFTVNVQAEAEVEVLMPEFGEALDRYTILDFVPTQEIQIDGVQVFTQRYTLQPYLSGEQSIPPVLVEFVDNRPGQTPTPDDLDAYEILTDRVDFEVKSVLPKDASTELKPPVGELQLKREVSTATRIGWFIALIALVAALIFAVPLYRKWQRQRSRKNAYEIARQWLDYELAKPTPTTDEQIEQYYVAISKVVRTYLENRFELRAPDLTTEEFLELAGASNDLSREHQSLLRDFLRQADLVKFAGIKASGDEIQRAAEIAIQFLEETRENAPIVDDIGEQQVAEERIGV